MVVHGIGNRVRAGSHGVIKKKTKRDDGPLSSLDSDLYCTLFPFEMIPMDTMTRRDQFLLSHERPNISRPATQAQKTEDACRVKCEHSLNPWYLVALVLF